MNVMRVRGMSQISACGVGCRALKEALSSPPQKPYWMPIGHSSSATKRVPVMRAEPGRSCEDLDIRRTRRMDRLCTLLVDVAQSALRETGGPLPAAERVGVITATGYGGLAGSFRFLDDIIEDGDKAGSPFVFAAAVNNASSTSIARYFDFRGPCLTLLGSHNLVIDALRIASLWLANGMVDMVVTAFGDEYHPVLGYGLSQESGWPQDGVMHPLWFDQQTFVPGETFACFILSSVNEGQGGPVVDPTGTYSDLGSQYEVRNNQPQFLAAQGNAACGPTYREVALRACCNVSYSACWGGGPTADAMTLAAALVSVNEGCLWPPYGSETVESSVKVPQAIQGLPKGSVACVMGAEDGGGSVVRVSSSVESLRV